MCAAMQLLSTKNGVQVASYRDAKHLYLFFHALVHHGGKRQEQEQEQE
jgi:hypothetical protein